MLFDGRASDPDAFSEIKPYDDLMTADKDWKRSRTLFLKRGICTGRFNVSLNLEALANCQCMLHIPVQLQKKVTNLPINRLFNA